MSDTSDLTTDDPAQPAPATPETGDQGSDLTAEVEKWKALSKKNEERAKANAAAAKELDEFRRQSMTETEKAIEAARTEARREAFVEAGGKVAAAEIRAAAAGRLDEEQLDTLLEGLNLARFVGDDGEVDRAAVAKFVDGIAPRQDDKPTPLDFGQGARSSSHALNGDPLKRSLEKALGI